MTNITINDKKMTIEMTKAVANKARKFNSAEYKALQMVRKDYPNYEVVVRTTSKKSAKNSFKGLTYNYMEKYIEAHDDEDKSIMREYLDMRALSEDAIEAMADALSYGEIKAWFLDKYPQIKEFHTRRENLMVA